MENYLIFDAICLEKNLYKDLTYILKWFNIDIDVKDTTQKLK